MNTPSAQGLFRNAAEAEGGAPISAGARVGHVRLAIESGRAVVIDLTGVPEADRNAVIAEIEDLVRNASTKQPPVGVATTNDAGESRR